MKKNLFLITLLTGSILSSCDKVNVAELEMGQLPDEEVLSGLPAINLRAINSLDNIVTINLPEGGDFTSVKLFAQATRNLDVSKTVKLSVDETLVESYNANNKSEFRLLPAPFYSIDNDGVIDIPAGAKESDEKMVRFYATNPLGNMLEVGEYLLPLRLSTNGVEIPDSEVFFFVNCERKFSEVGELLVEDDAFFVFYLDTKEYDPRLLTDYYIDKRDPETWDLIWTKTIGNIVNLKQSTLSFDSSSGRVLLRLHEDLRYVLERYDTYIKPLQDNGRRVCLCIEGGNSGHGFCNLSDVQISDFVSQIKVLFNYYPLDGINLWDKNSGYNQEDAPAVNTTSYPKLIASLRDVLGTNKILTLTDYGEPTSSFWSTDMTGGVEVGRYLDFAWSGYNSRADGYQIVDPYHQNQPMVSKLYPRKPIRGLAPEKYGCINSPWMDPTSGGDFSGKNVRQWISKGLYYNKILVFEDAQTNLQNSIEGIWRMSMPNLLDCLNPSFHYEFNNDELDSIYGSDGYVMAGYNKWKKDW